MFTKLFPYRIVFSVVFIIFIFLNSCDIKNPVENVDVIFNAKAITTIITGNFTDAKTGQPLTGRKVNIFIEGKNKDNIVNLTEEPHTSFTVSEGFLSFALTEDIHPSSEYPVSITIIAEAAGYKSNFINLDIVNTGSSNFEISMVSENNLPDGISSTTGIIKTNSSGAATEEAAISTTEPLSGLSAGVTFPQGVIIKDKNGIPLTGNLTFNITFYSPSVEDASESFPGGFNVYINKNGIKQQGSFISAGAAEITLKDASGREGVSFSNSAVFKKSASELLPELRVEISSQTINPETRTFIKAGDEVDMWSRPTNKADWMWEKRCVIQYEPLSRKFYAVYKLEHLSILNLDWFLDNCPLGGTIRFTGVPAGYPLLIVMRLPGYYKRIIINDGILNFIWAPDFPVTISVFDLCTNQLLYSSNNINPCTVNMTINLNINANVVDITLSGEAWCPDNPSVIIRPTFPVYAKNLNCPVQGWFFKGTLSGGSGVIKGLISGDDYEFGASYEGSWYQASGTISENGGLSGVYFYYHSDNLVTVNVGSGGSGISGFGLILDSTICK